MKVRHIIQLLSFGLFIFGIFNAMPLLITLILVLTIIGGPFHCGWLCPFGTLQEFMSNLASKLAIKKIRVHPLLDKILKSLRYILLVVFTFLSIDFLFELFKFEPRENLNSFLYTKEIIFFSLVALVIFALASLFIERFYCRYLCIEGAKHGLFSLIRPITIHRADSCIDCKKCDKVCPMAIEVSTLKENRSPSCINCFSCINSCPVENTLVYKPVKLSIFNLLLYLILVLVFITGYNLAKVETVQEQIQESDTLIYNNGIYQASAMGFRGMIEVEVTYENDLITHIKVLKHHEDMKWYNHAYSVVQEMLDKQSVEVDTITGATYSSKGIIDAVKATYNEAKKLRD